MKSYYNTLQAAGLLASAASSIYSNYGSSKSSTQSGFVSKKRSQTLSNLNSYSKKMANYKKSKYASKKLFKKSFDISKKKKGLWKKKKMRKFKKFAKYLEKVDTHTTPYSIEAADDYRSWTAATSGAETLGNSNIFSIDTGLSRDVTTADSTKNGIWNNTHDDLWHAFRVSSVAGVSRADAQVFNNPWMLEYNKTKICVRNNTNIGCKVEVYLVERKKNNSTTSDLDNDVLMGRALIQAMKNSYNPPTTENIQNQMSYSDNLFDYPNACGRFNIKLVKNYIHYPAVTKFFNLSTPFVGYARNTADTFRYTADPRFHRALVFVVKGLPVHSSTDPDFTSGSTCFGNWKLDVLISRKIKVRKLEWQSTDNHHNTKFTKVPTISIGNQEIQPAVNPSNSLITS